MNWDAASPNDDAPIIVTANADVLNFIRPALPGCRFPRHWESEDPIAALRAISGDARIYVGYGGMPLGHETVDALPRLGLVVSVGAGYDGIDPVDLARRGIVLTNSSGLNSEEVADRALALALAARCQIIEGDTWVRSGRWRREGWMPPGRSFGSLRAGIVGMGHIGQAIARRLAGFGNAIHWWNPRDQSGLPWPKADSLTDLARDADILFLAMPGGPLTHRMIDSEVIAALGADAILVNVARGSVLDEDTLISALVAGRLGGAALDVFSTEPADEARWHDVPNVVLSPHTAGNTLETSVRMRQNAAANICRFIAGEPVEHRVRPT